MRRGRAEKTVVEVEHHGVNVRVLKHLLDFVFVARVGNSKRIAKMLANGAMVFRFVRHDCNEMSLSSSVKFGQGQLRRYGARLYERQLRQGSGVREAPRDFSAKWAPASN